MGETNHEAEIKLDYIYIHTHIYKRLEILEIKH